MTASLLLLSCDSKESKTERAVKDYQTAVEQTVPDTVVQEKAKKDDAKGKTEEVKPSSTPSDKPDDKNNMRSFDPASENDMPDNGMSRYMENNDEEGWE